MNNQNNKGFTLIELMIALTMIGMALVIAFAALRLSMRSLERTGHLTRDLEEMRVIRSVMHSQVSQARPLRVDENEKQLDFRGDEHVIEFVAPAPVQDDRIAGLYRYQLRFMEDEEGRSLVLDYLPYQVHKKAGSEAQHESTVLVSNLGEGGFSYYGTLKNEGAQWTNQWEIGEQLPRMIKVTLQRTQLDNAHTEMVVIIPAERVR